MKKIYLTAGLCAALFAVSAQNIATFEDVELQTGSFYNGSDRAGGFTSGGIGFPNSFDSQSWSGFSVSNMKDTLTPGFGNQYSAITAGGVDSSENYAVVYFPGTLKMEFDEPTQVAGFYVTNSTYAYLSLRDGDGYSKKFGGADGSDPDYFKLLVSEKDESGNPTDTLEFYLADFRFENSEEDYILNVWKWLDLSNLGNVTELNFGMESTDVGDWGINTPAYFCVDNFTIGNVNSSATLNSRKEHLNVFPNPVKDYFTVDLPLNTKRVVLTESAGRIIFQQSALTQNRIQISALGGMPSGFYFLKVQTESGILTKKMVKY